MNNLEKTDEVRKILRWGGLSGVLGSIILLIVFGIVIIFVGETPPTLQGLPIRFPSVRAARTVENGLYLVALILWVFHHLALFQTLRETRLASALFGSVMGILSLAMLIAGALPHVATSLLSDLYHAPGVTAAQQDIIAYSWQATQGIFEALLLAGLVFLPICFILTGVALLGTPTFGKGYGGMSVALGLLGTVAAVVIMIDPASSFAVISVFGLIIFHFVLGWKVYSLSRTSQDTGKSGKKVGVLSANAV